MPGTLDHTMREQVALIQWPARVRAGRGERAEPISLPQDHYGDAAYYEACQLAILDLVKRSDRFVVLSAMLPGSMVDVGPEFKDQMAAEVCRHSQDSKPHKVQYGGRHTLARAHL